MRVFSQYLQGYAKEWFKHLQPESISTWEEISDIFLNFWGKRRPLDQILSEFYSLKRQEGETMSSFSRRFARFYYNMPKEIQPLKNTTKIYYATTFPPELSLLLLERKSVTLYHMFIDCLVVEDNLRVTKKISDQDSGEGEKKLDFVETHKKRKHSLCISNLLLVNGEIISPVM